jgi:arabinofuranosyltransferase
LRKAKYLLIALSLLLVWKFLFWGWIFDDSYIAFRFSENWATGHGLTWNAGEDPVEGFTSFSWVLIGAIGQRVFGIPPHRSMVVVGIACWFVLIAVLLPRMTEAIAAPGLFTVLILALNPYLGFNAFHGLETALHVLVFCLVIHLALREPTAGNVTALAAASLVSFTVRPDALAFVLPVWAIGYLYSEPGRQRRRIAAGMLAFVVALGVYTLIKWRWFGYPLPNTFYIKHGGLLSGLGYVKGYFLVLIPAWLVFAFAAGRAGFSRLLQDRTFILLSVPAIAFCLAYVKLNPVLGQGYRFLIPTLPLITLACLRACILASPRRAGELAVYGVAMSAALLFFGAQMYSDYGGFRSYFGAIDQRLVATGRKLRGAADLPSAPLLATGDIGAVPYFSRLPTLDLIGLADETIAHDGLTYGYLLRRSPDLLILQDLYLSEKAGADDVVIEVAGQSKALNKARYGGVLPAPERAHSGAGSTYQVATAPAFANSYRYVTDWDFAGSDRYYIFVRRGYGHADELARMILQ